MQALGVMLSVAIYLTVTDSIALGADPVLPTSCELTQDIIGTFTAGRAPGNGTGAAMIAWPGTYRVSAQVAYPRQTGWSTPVEFVVTAPNKAIQKAPDMFGP